MNEVRKPNFRLLGWVGFEKKKKIRRISGGYFLRRGSKNNLKHWKKKIFDRRQNIFSETGGLILFFLLELSSLVVT